MTPFQAEFYWLVAVGGSFLLLLRSRMRVKKQRSRDAAFMEAERQYFNTRLKQLEDALLLKQIGDQLEVDLSNVVHEDFEIKNWWKKFLSRPAPPT